MDREIQNSTGVGVWKGKVPNGLHPSFNVLGCIFYTLKSQPFGTYQDAP